MEALWAIIGMRLAVLSAERIAFHGLGQRRDALATTMVAYGGAAIVLWALQLGSGRIIWTSQAFWPGAVYGLSFALYTAALVEGQVSVVSAFANVTVLFLFAAAPRWDSWSLAGLGLFFSGGALLFPRGRQGSRRAILLMVLSDAALALGRLLDASHPQVPSLPYAASLFSSVVLWLAIPLILYGKAGEVGRLVKERPGWAFLAALCNALSYLTVLSLLRRLTPDTVEAVSAWAGVIATMGGIWVFGESGALKKVLSALLITSGTVILLFSHGARVG